MTDNELVDIARTAYNLALAPHHPLLVVGLANLAIFALPWREDFLNSIIKEQTRMRQYDYTLEELFHEFEIFVPMAEELYAKMRLYIE